MKKIAIYGAGGFGSEVACLINAINRVKPEWEFIGFFDDDSTKQSNEFGKVLGGIDTLNGWTESLSVVLSIGKPKTVASIVSKIRNPKIDFPNLLAPDLIILDPSSFSMGQGNLLMFQSLVSCKVKIGDFNLFNCGVGLGHELTMGSYNSVMSYVKISGNVKAGNSNFFGVCSVVLQNIEIGNDTTIGANSVIMRNTKDFETYFGNPARELPKPRN